jgi:hypothetical protein
MPVAIVPSPTREAPPQRARAKEQIKNELLSGGYRFSLLSRITLKDGAGTDLWSARDALVLKALALVLGKHLPVSSRCTHIRLTAVRSLPCAPAKSREVVAVLPGMTLQRGVELCSHSASPVPRLR